MSIEFQINTVTIRNEDIEENYPFIFSAFQQCLPTTNKNRRRTKKKRIRVSTLIDPILNSINEN